MVCTVCGMIRGSDIDSGLRYAVPPRPDLATYVVYVGFDDIGDKNGKLATRKAAAR
jgi:hypothetical protein